MNYFKKGVRESNQSKLDSAFAAWTAPLQAKPADWALYCQQHAIPALASYWLDRFEAFFNERRALLMGRLKAELS